MLQIVYCLTGDDKFPPILDRQMDRFVLRLRDEIEDLIWEGKLRGYASASILFDKYQGLSDSDRTKFFLSPQGFEAIHAAAGSRTEDALRALGGAIDEHHAFEAAATLQVGEHGAEEHPVRQRSVVGGTIVLDIGSSWARRHDPGSPVLFAPFEPLTPDEANKVTQKLCAALAEIEAATPTFARLIRNYTRTIIVRKIGELSPASEQVDTELGAIRLRNVHADTYSHDQLVDDLIHESTHNFLGTFEFINFPFVPFGERAGEEVRPVSSWSMRPIQVLPFLHAVFVYFAMFNYASKRLQEAELSAECRKRLQRRRNRYASGFLMPGRLSSYVADLAKVDPRVLAAIENMETVVRSAAGANVSAEEAGSELAMVA